MPFAPDSSDAPLEAPSLVDLTADRIRSEIASGRYKASERLVERKLASSLGTSTIVVREALSRLVSDGLVLRIPRRGAIVTPTGEKAVRDQTRTRLALEQLVTECAAERWSSDASREGHAILKRIKGALRDRDWPQFAQADGEFHALRWRVADNGALTEAAERLYTRYVTQMSQVVIASPRITEPPDPEATIYSTWLDALDAGDVARAKEVVRRHVNLNGELILEQLRIAQSEDDHGTVSEPGS